MQFLKVIEEQYNSQVHLAYQQLESKLENLCTLQSDVVGDRTYFNFSTAAAGRAGQKGFLGDIPLQGGALDRVPCDLATDYAGDMIDEQDLSKTSVSGDLVITTNTMGVMAREKDYKIIDAASLTTNTIVNGGTGFTIAKAETLWTKFQDGLVFERGEVPIVFVGSVQWRNLMRIPEFKSADYIGHNDLPWLFTGAQRGRFWNDMIFKCHPLLQKVGNIRKCLAWVPSCIGFATDGKKKIKVAEIDMKDAILYYTREKTGACLIDATGCVSIDCDETWVYS